MMSKTKSPTTRMRSAGRAKSFAARSTPSGCGLGRPEVSREMSAEKSAGPKLANRFRPSSTEARLFLLRIPSAIPAFLNNATISSEPSLGTEARAAASSNASRISHAFRRSASPGDGLDVLEDRFSRRAGQEPSQLGKIQRLRPGERPVEVEEHGLKHSYRPSAFGGSPSRKETTSEIRTGLAMKPSKPSARNRSASPFMA